MSDLTDLNKEMNYLIDSQLDRIIANSDANASDLTRIEKHFRAHMYRQIALEHAIEESLAQLKGTNDGNR